MIDSLTNHNNSFFVIGNDHYQSADTVISFKSNTDIKLKAEQDQYTSFVA